MKNRLTRVVRLLFGIFLYALGIYFTLQANIGYAPWDVFHAGLAKTAGITFGVAAIYVGVAICAITLLLGEKLGLGTILNMLLIGIILDILIAANFIPIANSLFLGAPMLLLGLFIISLGSYFYIGSGFGAGPRDSLMVALTRKTNLPVGLIRGGIETTAAIIGYFLGGLIGIGTLLSAVAIGFIIQYTFKVLNFDSTQIEHETLAKTMQSF